MKKRPQSDLDSECSFSNLPKNEIETACKYEYMRESRALRDALNGKGFYRKPVFSLFVHDSMTPGMMYRLVLALRKAGFPKPWTALKKNARKELIPAISDWYEERKKTYPPVVIEDTLPERDLEGERERLVCEQSLVTGFTNPKRDFARRLC